MMLFFGGDPPESKTADVLATQTGEALLGKLLQVVGSLIIDHHSQNEAIRHVVHILCKATTLVLTAVRVKPEGVKVTLLFPCCWHASLWLFSCASRLVSNYVTRLKCGLTYKDNVPADLTIELWWICQNTSIYFECRYSCCTTFEAKKNHLKNATA